MGYTTIELTKEYSLLGVPFFPLVTENNDGISIQEFITGNFSDGDEVQIPQASGFSYNRAVWYTDENGDGFWSAIRGSSGATGVPSTLKVHPGEGFWIYRKNFSPDIKVEATVKGKVELASQMVKELSKQYQIISFPQPVELNVTSGRIEWHGLKAGDEIQIPDQSGNSYSYNRAIWYTDANSGRSYWSGHRQGRPTGVESTLIIPANVGIWLVTSGDGASVTYNLAN